jgi:outer membrane usher protein
MFVSARWSLSPHGDSLRATSRSTTTGEVVNELAYTRQAGGPPGGLATSVSLHESGESVAGRGEARYAGYRFTSSVSTTASLDHGALTEATSLEVATALAFAGGRAAWSRPITGSFAIVAANEPVAGFPIGVNPALGGYAARSDAFGAAVIPNLEAYRVGVVRIEAPTLPVGYSLGPSSYRILPAYKSGTLLPVGERGTVSLRGTLRTRGAPIAFAVGELAPIDDKTLPVVVVMSNRAGRFAVTGLLPGRYEVRIDERTAVVTIAHGAAGVVSADIDLE